MMLFDRLTAIAAPLPKANVDTDQILPARFLKTIARTGLGGALFATMREDASFVLNRAPWDHAGALIAGPNFGTGSSREHAPWALLDFGIRCVVAPSIADIFYNNCFKNGILPIALDKALVATLMAIAADPSNARMTVDLVSLSIEAGGSTYGFTVDPQRRTDLLSGTDEIARSLGQDSAIDGFEATHREAMPWIAPITQVALLQLSPNQVRAPNEGSAAAGSVTSVAA